MIGLFRLYFSLLIAPFKSKLRLEAENAALRHQLIILRRRVRGRVGLTNNDRWFLNRSGGFPRWHSGRWMLSW